MDSLKATGRSGTRRRDSVSPSQTASLLDHSLKWLQGIHFPQPSLESKGPASLGLTKGNATGPYSHPAADC